MNERRESNRLGKIACREAKMTFDPADVPVADEIPQDGAHVGRDRGRNAKRLATAWKHPRNGLVVRRIERTRDGLARPRRAARAVP